MEMSFFDSENHYGEASSGGSASGTTSAPAAPASKPAPTTQQQPIANVGNILSDLGKSFTTGWNTGTDARSKVGGGIEQLGKTESDFLKNIASNVPVIGQFLSKLPNFGDTVSSVGAFISGQSKGDILGVQMRDKLAAQLRPLGFNPVQVAWLINTGLPSRDALSNPAFVKQSMYDMSYGALKKFPKEFTLKQVLVLRAIAEQSVTPSRPTFDPAPFNAYVPSDLQTYIDAANAAKKKAASELALSEYEKKKEYLLFAVGVMVVILIIVKASNT